jgi:hypothetical protein
VTWYSTGANRYPVAELTPDGTVLLRFGKHAGQLLEEVPTSYLRWLSSGPFLPLDLRERARSYALHRRLVRPDNLRPVEDAGPWPDLRDREAVVTYIFEVEAAGEVASLTGYLRELLEVAENALRYREQVIAEALEAAVLRALTGGDEEREGWWR